MQAAARKSGGGGIWESLYKVVMRRNSVYVTFVITGAFLGERAVDYGVHKLWEYNNQGAFSFWSLGSTVFKNNPSWAGLIRKNP